MNKTILIVKETRAGETRVALIPADVKKLVTVGFTVFVEQGAGQAAGFTDQDYITNGAIIRELKNNDLAAFEIFFKDIDIIARVKRPDRAREILENKTILSGAIMVGALDPLEKNSEHMEEYHQKNIQPHSIDQLKLEITDPMNLLAAMSRMAGRLALLDAVKKSKSLINKVVIIGFGGVGQSAFAEAIQQKFNTTVLLNNAAQCKQVQNDSGTAVVLNSDALLAEQQNTVKEIVIDADIVITGARKPNELAPLLIPLTTLQQMKSGAVIVDMALSEGGNVENSEHDMDKILGNGVIVTNTSGYPKAHPQEASIAWSQATMLYILKCCMSTNRT